MQSRKVIYRQEIAVGVSVILHILSFLVHIQPVTVTGKINGVATPIFQNIKNGRHGLYLTEFFDLIVLLVLVGIMRISHYTMILHPYPTVILIYIKRIDRRGKHAPGRADGHIILEKRLAGIGMNHPSTK